MYQIRREIDPSSRPTEWETLATLETPQEVTAWLCDPQHNLPANLAYCGRMLRVVDASSSKEWTRSEWLCSRRPRSCWLLGSK